MIAVKQSAQQMPRPLETSLLIIEKFFPFLETRGLYILSNIQTLQSMKTDLMSQTKENINFYFRGFSEITKNNDFLHRMSQILQKFLKILITSSLFICTISQSRVYCNGKCDIV